MEGEEAAEPVIHVGMEVMLNAEEISTELGGRTPDFTSNPDEAVEQDGPTSVSDLIAAMVTETRATLSIYEEDTFGASESITVAMSAVED